MSPGAPTPPPADLFEDVVRRAGLAPWVGPSLLRKALGSAGVSQTEAGPEHYRQVLPELKARMAVYLDPAELEARLADIETLLRCR